MTEEKKKQRGRPRAFNREEALRGALSLFWQQGYEPTSIAQLCDVMQINKPSLYAAFGNKSDLFLEAVDYYETTYWDGVWQQMFNEPDLRKAIKDFFITSAEILTSREFPCGCMVVLAAINIRSSETEILKVIRQLRLEGYDWFRKRLLKGREDGQLGMDVDIDALAVALNTFLEGLSIQVHDGVDAVMLKAVARCAVDMIPD